MATADTEPVTVQQREAWFRELTRGALCGCLRRRRRPGSLAVAALVLWPAGVSPHGRSGIYVDLAAQRRHRGALDHALAAMPRLDIATLLAFVFATHAVDRLFRRFGFDAWGTLPRVAELDGVERDLAILGRRVAA
jgi:phosphinothricin acetyltransferase